MLLQEGRAILADEGLEAGSSNLTFKRVFDRVEAKTGERITKPRSSGGSGEPSTSRPTCWYRCPGQAPGGGRCGGGHRLGAWGTWTCPRGSPAPGPSVRYAASVARRAARHPAVVQLVAVDQHRRPATATASPEQQRRIRAGLAEGYESITEFWRGNFEVLMATLGLAADRPPRWTSSSWPWSPTPRDARSASAPATTSRSCCAPPGRRAGSGVVALRLRAGGAGQPIPGAGPGLRAAGLGVPGYCGGRPGRPPSRVVGPTPERTAVHAWWPPGLEAGTRAMCNWFCIAAATAAASRAPPPGVRWIRPACGSSIAARRSGQIGGVAVLGVTERRHRRQVDGPAVWPSRPPAPRPVSSRGRGRR